MIEQCKRLAPNSQLASPIVVVTLNMGIIKDVSTKELVLNVFLTSGSASISPPLIQLVKGATLLDYRCCQLWKIVTSRRSNVEMV